jgi:hypothetical protein
VKQYSISNNEYDFWNNLKKAGETGGDIFASQPYTVISNLHNVKNAGEMVLGYFEVSSVVQNRIFITPHDLDSLDLPYYKTSCELISKSLADFNYSMGWNDIYHMYLKLGYTFVGPEVTPGINFVGNVQKNDLLKLDFSTKVCSICELTGFTTKPDFWVDLK